MTGTGSIKERSYRQFKNSRVYPEAQAGRSASTQDEFVGYEELEAQELILHDIVKFVSRPESSICGQVY